MFARNNMKTFSNKYTDSMVTMISVGNNKILTGDANGNIRLWLMTRRLASYDFDCKQVFSGHSGKVNCLALLPDNRFISSSADNTMRIWNMTSENCEKILNANYDVPPSACESIAVLPDDLIAVAGNRSPAWGGFDIWDVKTGRCIFSSKALVHRPEGMSITAAKGYLAVRPHYHANLSIWEVNHSKCIQVSQLSKIHRIFAMTTSPLGEILMVGDSLHIITLADDGTIQQHKAIANSNCIDSVFSVGAYRVLIVDSRFNANRLKLLDYLADTDEVLGYSIMPLRQFACDHVVFARDSMVLSIGHNQFCIQQFSKFDYTPKDVAEIRKNSRLLAQAFRTQTSFFSHLPRELNYKIAALTSDMHDEKRAEKISIDHFSKPVPF